MLELAILGLLKEQPMHGYDLRKRLRSGFGLLATLSFGSLYPALARLEKAGAVRAVDLPAPPPGEVIPLTGSLSGDRAAFRLRARLAARPSAGRTRERKVYELTEKGEEMFTALLSEEAEARGDERSFTVRWSFARYLSGESRLRLLERQRRRLEDRLGDAERALRASAGSLDLYERQIAEHAVESLGKDLAWIDSLIASEKSGSLEPASGAGQEPALTPAASEKDVS